ncbi:hypothetical protein C488_03846 [Natrinema pellirubrum DSM 15624]|uniref:DUF7344 domain-containing protein n=1 Tax=Natrinema pellirubrum (strain DSM 15624 / CIP 106293 / JCM 10476 / NCIMB 786 / 157) TaxID=797303 RepID=L0JIQ1_NATP1|nr:hypothetical protein [Natrinema pellirubrum]AGB30723.1 hypothetical protein Natpe_0805 [Natrinema pellirubrum DSM 15624]ELY80405.1 hypothetical protein C488_03846 [Natrinema pellirubrum DSM 15624]
MTHQDGASSEAQPVIDRSLAALSDPYRRSVCRYAMRTQTTRLDHAEIADYIVDRASPADDLDRRTVATELRHLHLPKLEDAGLLEYERDSGVVHADRERIADRLERLRATIAELQDVSIDR